MRHIINLEEFNEPGTVRYWATVERRGMEGRHLAGETLEDLIGEAPDVIRSVVELSNEEGANLPTPTEFEFRHLVHA
jgi:predicted RNase H-like HicB family nuclease